MPTAFPPLPLAPCCLEPAKLVVSKQSLSVTARLPKKKKKKKRLAAITKQDFEFRIWRNQKVNALGLTARVQFGNLAANLNSIATNGAICPPFSVFGSLSKKVFLRNSLNNRYWKLNSVSQTSFLTIETPCLSSIIKTANESYLVLSCDLL